MSKDKGRRTIQLAVAGQLPGWKVASSARRRDPAKGIVPATGAADFVLAADKAPTMAQLRAKFLGPKGAADAVQSFRRDDYPRETLKVEPKKGGEAKTADFQDGKVSIVQG